MNDYDNFMTQSTAKAFIADTPMYVLGDGGFGKEVKQLLFDYGSIQVVLVGKYQEGIIPDGSICFIAVGNPKMKLKIYDKIFRTKSIIKFPTVNHPTSIIGNAMFDEGNIICAGTIFTVGIQVEMFNVFNLNCTIGHDCKIGGFNQINPGTNISGNVTIGDRCLIGTGVQILEGISIFSDVTVGAGAVVTKDLREPGTYVGIPARRIK